MANSRDLTDHLTTEMYIAKANSLDQFERTLSNGETDYVNLADNAYKKEYGNNVLSLKYNIISLSMRNLNFSRKLLANNHIGIKQGGSGRSMARDKESFSWISSGINKFFGLLQPRRNISGRAFPLDKRSNPFVVKRGPKSY